jgi:general stress protein 26
MSEVDRHLGIASKIINNQNYCTLITSAGEDSPNARVVQPLPPEADLTHWFGTSPRSRKVQDILQHPDITVLYFAAHGMSYVTLQGRAQLIDDIEERKTRWAEGWRMFFPDGPEGDDYILIRFEPVRLELMSFEYDVTPPPFGLLPAVLIRQGNEWVMNEAFRSS